jgi:DNA-binding CsgD family transcriptional regulator/tetratricopeptide (TPR) repeat protein
MEQEVDVLEGLASLVDQSLVRRAGDEKEARFTMLQTVREFALARLEDSGEELAVRRAHAAYYRGLAEQAEPGLKGPDQQRWRDRLEAELDNLRAALAWSVEVAPDRADAEGALYTAGALWYFWYWRGLPSEGRRWLSRALEATPKESPARARALLGAGSLAWRQSDYDTSRLLLEESVARWRELDDSRGLAEALHLLGHSYFDQQDYEAARARFEESRSTYSAVGDSLVGLPLVGDLGMVAYHTGRYEEAKDIFTECLVLFRQHGLNDRTADTLGRLGDLARLEGDLEGAARLYGESQELWRGLHADPGVASSMHKLGQVHRRRGDEERARALLAESLRLQRDSGNRQGVAECLAGLAGVASSSGRPEVAGRLLGAASVLLEKIGAPLAPADAADLERDLAQARHRLGEPAWTTAWEAGRATGMEQAIEIALAAEARPTPPADLAQSATSSTAPLPLSPREQEVAALVAEGLTNRDVASQLGISEKTAANHVEHIMNKLDFRSRAQVAVWAVEHGLGRRSH